MSSSHQEIDDLLVLWEELREKGKPCSPEDLCRDHPELLDELRDRVKKLEEIDRLIHIPRADQAPTVEPARLKETIQEYPSIPGYKILKLLGHGGMGVVYQARHLALNRIVAIKMILTGKFANDRQRKRFRNEAEALARVSHPNIVQIYEVGESEGCPFLCLEYVGGGNLATLLNGNPQNPRQAAQIVATLARAIYATHQSGIIHRDLKPGNILLTHPSEPRQQPAPADQVTLTTDGGLSRSGSPKITDFGLAKRLDEKEGQTETQAVLGTPSYMPPEMAYGKAREATPATDIYALGAILYEMLTGQPPFIQKEEEDVLEQVRTKDPVPPRRLQSTIPRPLQTICLTCLHKKPDGRYPSAEALAQDLEAFLVGGKILARPQSTWERIVKEVTQHPVVAVVIVAVLLSTIALAAGGYVFALAVSSLALIGLVVGGAIYNRRLRRAFQKVAEQNQVIAQHRERLELLLDTTQRLLIATDLDALHLISETATQLVQAESATLYLVDHSKKELWSKVVLGPNVGEIRLPIGKGIAGTVAETGQVINLADAYKDPRFNPEVDKRSGYRTRNLLTFPMMEDDGRIIGVLQLVNKREGAFSLQDVAALRSLTTAATIALRRLLSPPRRHPQEKSDPTQDEDLTATEHDQS